MDKQDILSNLCYYDKRNPDSCLDEEYKKSPCYCDNCFDGRSQLAEYILSVLKEKTTTI